MCGRETSNRNVGVDRSLIRGCRIIHISPHINISSVLRWRCTAEGVGARLLYLFHLFLRSGKFNVYSDLEVLISGVF
jgi:hypothetical protein